MHHERGHGRASGSDVVDLDAHSRGRLRDQGRDDGGEQQCDCDGVAVGEGSAGGGAEQFEHVAVWDGDGGVDECAGCCSGCGGDGGLAGRIREGGLNYGI